MSLRLEDTIIIDDMEYNLVAKGSTGVRGVSVGVRNFIFRKTDSSHGIYIDFDNNKLTVRLSMTYSDGDSVIYNEDFENITLDFLNDVDLNNLDSIKFYADFYSAYDKHRETLLKITTFKNEQGIEQILLVPDSENNFVVPGTGEPQSYYRFHMNLYMAVLNKSPKLTVEDTDIETLNEDDILKISGTVLDQDIDDVVTVKYKVNDSSVHNIKAFLSSGEIESFVKELRYREKGIYDGSKLIIGNLKEDIQHTITLWRV